MVRETDPVFAQWANIINQARQEFMSNSNVSNPAQARVISLEKDPATIVRRRYAKGEISWNEYVQMLQDLGYLIEK